MYYKKLKNSDEQTILANFSRESCVTHELVNEAYDCIVFTERRDEKNHAFAVVIAEYGLDINQLSPKIRKYVRPFMSSVLKDDKTLEVVRLRREIDELKELLSYYDGRTAQTTEANETNDELPF